MLALPDLAFEQILEHLELKELIKSRAVSRGWLQKVDRFRVECLCFSEWEKDHILDKYRRISGRFSSKFIRLSNFEFFKTFANSILRNLKHLRVLDLNVEQRCPNFIVVLNSLNRLVSLGIIAVHGMYGDLQLTLENLRSIHLEDVPGHATLVLDAPRLSKIKVWDPNFKLIVVHPESVQSVVIKNDQNLELKRFKNLEVFHCERLLDVDSEFVCERQRLKAINFVGHQATLRALHDQKQRHNRTDLKIFYHGLCLNTVDDYAGLPNYLTLSEALVGRMIANFSRLTDELSFYEYIYYYSNIELAVPRVPAGFWRRFTGLRSIDVREVENIDRFLDFLKCFNNVVSLSFRHQQPQELFDQLPSHCSSLQVLNIESDPGLQFVFDLKHLFSLAVANQVDGEFIREVFGRLQWMRNFSFYFKGRPFSVSLNEQKKFCVFNCVRSQICNDLDDLLSYVSSEGR